MRAVVIGEALIDVFGDARVVGGAPLNVAVHLADRGWDVQFVTRIGRDADGERVLAVLDDFGVDRSLVEVDPQVRTGTVAVEMRGRGHTFTIEQPAAWDNLRGPGQLGAHDALIWGSLASRAPAARAAVARLTAQSSAALKVFDVNLRPPHVHVPALRAGLTAATLVKLNDAELEEVATALGLPAEPGALIEHFQGLRWLCVTLGEAGAALHDRSGGLWSVPAMPVQVVDTVGAGDAFLAGLVDGLGRRLEEHVAMEQGASGAAAVLARRGGLPARP